MLSNKLLNNNEKTALRPVYAAEKLGTDPSRKEYEHDFFARANAYHVFQDVYEPWTVFSVFGARDVYSPKGRKTLVPTSFFIPCLAK